MSDVITLSPGRCGTYYLYRVCLRHLPDRWSVVHEDRPARPFARSGSPQITTGYDAIVTCDALPTTVRVIHLLRDPLDNALSYGPLLLHEYGKADQYAGKPTPDIGTGMIPFSASWDALGQSLWWMYEAHLKALRVCETHAYFRVNFRDLNDPARMTALLSWIDPAWKRPLHIGDLPRTIPGWGSRGSDRPTEKFRVPYEQWKADLPSEARAAIAQVDALVAA